MALKKADLVLPASLVSQADARRLAQELEILNNLLTQHARTTNDAPAMPGMSRILSDLVVANKLDFTKAPHRQQLEQFLNQIKKINSLLWNFWFQIINDENKIISIIPILGTN